jgi:hypothetical protein
MTDLARFRQVQQAIERAEAIQARAAKLAVQDAGDRARNTGWMPFNLFDFNALLFEALKMIPDEGYFLDVGAGNGPFMSLARDVYGMEVHGIDVLEALAADAYANGLPVDVADAWSYTGYAKASCVWMNRPLRDRGMEAELEQRIWREMELGAVALCANLEHPPPSSWIIINDSWDSLQRGAWVKPHTATEG